jgi:hypothetical protein
MAVDIDSLQIEIKATSSKAATEIDSLVTALSSLKTVAKGGAGLTTVSKQLQALSAATASLNTSTLDTIKLGQLTSALNSLSQIQKATGLTSTINALQKIPTITETLKTANLDDFAKQMNQVANSVRPLANEMQKVSNGFAAFPIRIQKIISSNAGLAASNKTAGNSFGFLKNGVTGAIAKFSILGFGLKQVYNYAKSWVTESTDYVENLNLFTVTMGKAADEALRYAEVVKEAVGIDPSEWIRNQGMFKQITSGFGVVADKADLMSKNLTQLGYDRRLSLRRKICVEKQGEPINMGCAA